LKAPTNASSGFGAERFIGVGDVIKVFFWFDNRLVTTEGDLHVVAGTDTEFVSDFFGDDNLVFGTDFDQRHGFLLGWFAVGHRVEI